MKIFVVLGLLMSAAFAHAAADFSDYGIEAGFRSQNFDAKAPGSSTSETGYQLGVTGSLGISAPWVLRTGLMYVQRPLRETFTGGSDYRLKLSYVDIPVQFGYKMDYVTVYLGPSLSFKMSDDADGTLAPLVTKPTTQSLLVPVTLGAAFRFAPQIGANVFFEMGTGSPATDFNNTRAVGANLIVYFD